MSEKVLIASDSTCDLSKELIEKYDIKILPLGVTLGDKQYTDGVDITPEDIYEEYERTGRLPKTAAVNIADFTSFYQEYVDKGYSIVTFTIGSDMSSTYNNARLAAEDFDNVFVVDTQNLSTGGGLLVLSACRMAEQGKSAEEISRACEELVDRVDASFVIDNLEFLYKGGRCSALAALGANVLQLKPCIAVRNGKMGVTKKYRGKYGEVLKKYVAEQMANIDDIDTTTVFVTHAGCETDIVNACVEQVKQTGAFENVYITRAGCTISSHCGRNTLGVLFIRKQPISK